MSAAVDPNPVSIGDSATNRAYGWNPRSRPNVLPGTDGTTDLVVTCAGEDHTLVVGHNSSEALLTFDTVTIPDGYNLVITDQSSCAVDRTIMYVSNNNTYGYRGPQVLAMAPYWALMNRVFFYTYPSEILQPNPT